MIDWGVGIQRSYMKAVQGAPHYLHVRLETGDKYADAFRIKVMAHDGTTLDLLKSIFVSVSDFTKFAHENPGSLTDLKSIVLSNVPKKSQHLLDHERNFVLCSPTSCSILLSYLLGKDVNAVSFAHHCYDSGLNAYGSWPFNMAHAFELGCGAFHFTTLRCNSFANLHQRLQQGIPVVVSVRGSLEGAPKSYDKGHLLVVIGYDAHKQQVICHDPAFKDDESTAVNYSLKHFLGAWERSHRLAYFAEPAHHPVY